MDHHDAYETEEFAEVYDAVYADRDDVGFWQAMGRRGRRPAARDRLRDRPRRCSRSPAPATRSRGSISRRP